MTDNDIIKALECCGKNHILGKMSECKNCYLQNTTLCITELIYQSLDLINRQKAEIEELKEDNFIKSQKRANIFEITNAYERGRAEAITEFAERLKTEIQKSVNQYWSADGGGYYLAEDVIPDIAQIAKEMKEGVNNGN